MADSGASDATLMRGDAAPTHRSGVSVLPAPPHVVGGVLVSVAIDGALDPAMLHGDERSMAETLPVARRASFVAGRVALRAAVHQIAPHLRDVPLLRTVRGGPQLPDGVTGSVSHKRHRAIAIAAPWPRGGGGTADQGEWHVGIDLEERAAMHRPGAPNRSGRVEPERHQWALRLARRILTPRELTEFGARDSGAGRPEIPSSELRSPVESSLATPDEILVRFAVKEAIYKAIDPIVHRYVRFDEVEARLLSGGDTEVRLLLAEARRHSIRVTAAWRLEGDYIIASAECSR